MREAWGVRLREINPQNYKSMQESGELEDALDVALGEFAASLRRLEEANPGFDREELAEIALKTTLPELPPDLPDDET